MWEAQDLPGAIGLNMESMMRRRMNMHICAAMLSASTTFAATPAQEQARILTIRAKISDAPANALLTPSDLHWEKAAQQPLHLNRTPPLYEGDPHDDGERPEAEVRLLRLSDLSVQARIQWQDATPSSPQATTRKVDGGESHIYTEHTNATDQFVDAACIMIPKIRGPHANYPSLMMGDAANEVDMLYWRAGTGFQKLGAHGRASTSAQPDGVRGVAAYKDGFWSVVIRIADLPARTPICFALWDGEKLQRDGLKYFSLWYEVE